MDSANSFFGSGSIFPRWKGPELMTYVYLCVDTCMTWAQRLAIALDPYQYIQVPFYIYDLEFGPDNFDFLLGVLLVAKGKTLPQS